MKKATRKKARKKTKRASRPGPNTIMRMGVTKLTEHRRKDWPLYTVWANDGAAAINGLGFKELKKLHEIIGQAIEKNDTHHPLGPRKSIVWLQLI